MDENIQNYDELDNENFEDDDEYDLKYDNESSITDSDENPINELKETCENLIDENNFVGIKQWGKDASIYYNHDLQDVDMMRK